MLGLRQGHYGQPVRSEERLRSEQPATKKARPWRFLWIRLPALLLVLGSLYILHALFGNERYTVRHVTIDGTRLLPQEDVLAAMGVEQASVFWVNPKSLETHLLDTFPLLEEVSIRSVLPDRVEVRLTERSNVLLWESGGQTWWVDYQGTVLGVAESPVGLVVIHDVAGTATDASGRIAGVPWQLAWDLVRAMPTLSVMDYTREHGLVVYATIDHWPVYLGHEGDAARKAAIMVSLVQQLDGSRQRVAYIDLRNEHRPVYKRQ